MRSVAALRRAAWLAAADEAIRLEEEKAAAKSAEPPLSREPPRALGPQEPGPWR